MICIFCKQTHGPTNECGGEGSGYCSERVTYGDLFEVARTIGMAFGDIYRHDMVDARGFPTRDGIARVLRAARENDWCARARRNLRARHDHVTRAKAILAENGVWPHEVPRHA